MTTPVNLDERTAADLLVHYLFTLARAEGVPIHRQPDCAVEIRSIIRSTVEAAVQQTRAELQPQIDALTRMVGELSATVTALERQTRSISGRQHKKRMAKAGLHKFRKGVKR